MTVTAVVLFLFLLAGMPTIAVLMALRAAFGTGAARWLAAGASVLALAVMWLTYADAMPGHEGDILFHVLPAAVLVLWLASALAPGHWRRWPDIAGVLLPTAAIAVWLAVGK